MHWRENVSNLLVIPFGYEYIIQQDSQSEEVDNEE
jgi:hypothetical protein